MGRFASSLAAIAVVALGATGCAGELTTGRHVDALEGQLGSVAFSGAPEIRELRLTATELHIDLRLSDPATGAVMVAITVPRDTSAEAAGTTSYLLQNAQMVGCSGHSDGNWDFDCHPSDLSVDLSPSGRIQFDATYTADDCGSIDPGDPPQSVGGDVNLI